MSTTLTIRKLDARVKQLLRVRAATHGRAMEAEARDILTKAVLEPEEKPLHPPEETAKPANSVCESVRGTWKGRMTTDEILNLTRGE